MILDDAIADDLRALGFETTKDAEDDFSSHHVDFWGPDMDHFLVRVWYEFDVENKMCALGNLYVHPSHRFYPDRNYCRPGIGRTVTRRLAQESLWHGIDKIELCGVQGDGLSYWPSLGAYPATFSEQRFYRGLFNIVAGREQFSSSDLAIAAQALNTLREGNADLKTVWKSVARKEKDGGPSAPCLGDITRHTLFNDTDMILDLTDRDVLTRLGL